MRKKIVIQLLVSNSSLIANFALIIILARLLTPEDIGIFSMSAVLVSIAHVFRDFGVSSFLKQERELTPQIISGATGLLIASSWGMAICLYASSSLWAGFFNDARVADVIQVLAMGFAFIPMGAIPQALLMRDLNVKKSAWVTLISTTIYFISSIVLALQNYAHMTMAWANFINIIATGLAFNYVLDKKLDWRPTTQYWARISKFGMANLLASIVKSIDNALPDIALGKWSTANNVGLYSRANSTVNMVATLFNPTIYFFAVPYLAKTHHKQGSITREFLYGDSIIACILIPPLIGIGLMAMPIVTVLYGDKWSDAAAAVPWLCIAGAASVIFSLTAYAVTGRGKPGAVVPALMFTVTMKLIALFWLFDGSLRGFAQAVAFGQIVGLPAYLWVNWKHLDISPKTWALNISRPGPVWITSGILTWLTIDTLSRINSPIITILGGTTALASTTIIGYYLSRLPIKTEMLLLLNRLSAKKFS